MKTILLLAAVLIQLSVPAQIGGNYSFPFLNLSYNARAMGLGGNFISVKDKDVNLGILNPSLLNIGMEKSLAFNHAFLAGGINYGMVNYAFSLKEKGTMSGFIKYVDYGKMERTSVNGSTEGTFTPFEMILGSGFGKKLNERISVGGNLYVIYSQLETYNSFGAGIDFAGNYFNEDKNLLVTALVKHAGIQFNSYTSSGNSPLPSEFQMAGSYKLQHAPFRFSLLAHHLNKWDLTYNNPNITPSIDALTGDTIPVQKAGFIEKLGRHFTYQVEIILSDNIHLRSGFDYHGRKELALEQRPGVAGFSFGTGLYFNKFILDYGFKIHSRAGYNHMLTLTSDLSKWRK